jgi:hypothetical protein
VRSAMKTYHPVPVPPTTKRWLKVLLGLSISVPIALAPLLGKLPIPLFPALLVMIPESIRNSVIPISAATMGLVAVSVEFRSIEKKSVKQLLGKARRSLLFASLCLALFCIVHSMSVTRVDVLGGSESLYFVTGFKAPEAPPCTGKSTADCIELLTTKQSAIASYFGDGQIRLASLMLEVFYVAFFAYFGNVVGILVTLQSKSQ